MVEEKNLKPLIYCNGGHTKFVLISDTHIGGIYEDLDYYKRIYEIIAESNINAVFHMGDFFEGGSNPNDPRYNFYLDYKNCQNQIEKAILYYPDFENLKTFIVHGYHDTMSNRSLERVCMIEELCKYRKNLINITSKIRLNPKYINVHSDIYLFENIKLLFRHGDVENIPFVPNNDDICITITGHYHNFKYSNSDNSKVPKLNKREHRIHVPALMEDAYKIFDFIILEILEDRIIINPISIKNKSLSNKKIYIKR